MQLEFTCLNAPKLPLDTSVASSAVTGLVAPVVFRMVARIALSMLPYVAPWPSSKALRKQYVIAPVDVILDRACLSEPSARVTKCTLGTK